MSDPIKLAFDRFFEEAVKLNTRLFSLRIAGIEVTQSTQHFDAAAHLTDSADRGRDNVIPLIAGKSALVRVYVRNAGGDMPGVTGTLAVQRPGLEGQWRVLGNPSAVSPGTVTARADPPYASERGDLRATLNFRLPAWMVYGRLRLVARIQAPDGREDAMTLDIAAALKQTLRIRGFPIRYEGKDNAGNKISLPRTTLADFVATAGDALAMFPVADEPDITLAGDFNWFAPLDGNPDPTNPGGCAPSWNSLLYWLALVKTADGNRTDRIYYGLLPTGTPTGFNTGCGSTGGVSAGLAGDQGAFAHECGHVLGFGHTPCGLTPGDAGDPAYPAYEPYDTPTARMATIGEYGVDLRGPRLRSPNSVRDFMSYCGPQWIGPYHYRALLQHPLLAPRAIFERGPRLPDWVHERYVPELDLPRPPGPVEIEVPTVWTRPIRPQRLLTLTGTLVNGRLEQAELLRLPTRPPALGPALADSLIELLDSEGRVLDRTRLHRVALHGNCLGAGGRESRLGRTGGGCGCGGACGGGCGADEPGLETGLVTASLSDRDDITAARVVRAGETLWQRSGGSLPLRVSGLSAEIDRDGGAALKARWQIEADPHAERLHVMLRLSDGAERGIDGPSADTTTGDETEWSVMWSTVAGAAELPSHAAVALATLPSGRHWLEVVVCDGFHTARSDAVEVEIPARAPDVAILTPVDGRAVRCGEPVLLRGLARSADGRRLDGDALQWTLDGQPLGSGAEVEGALGPWEGEHRATLVAREAHGESFAEVIFVATCSGEPPVRLRRR